MSTFILVFESAVDNHGLVENVIKVPIEYLDHGVFADAWNSIRFIFWYEARKRGCVHLVNIHGGLMTRRRHLVVLLLIKDISRVLEHAEGSTKLFPWPCYPWSWLLTNSSDWRSTCATR